MSGDGQMGRDNLGHRPCNLPYAVCQCVSVCSQAHLVLYCYDFTKVGKSGPQESSGISGDKFAIRIFLISIPAVAIVTSEISLLL